MFPWPCSGAACRSAQAGCVRTQTDGGGKEALAWGAFRDLGAASSGMRVPVHGRACVGSRMDGGAERGPGSLFYVWEARGRPGRCWAKLALTACAHCPEANTPKLMAVPANNEQTNANQSMNWLVADLSQQGVLSHIPSHRCTRRISLGSGLRQDSEKLTVAVEDPRNR